MDPPNLVVVHHPLTRVRMRHIEKWELALGRTLTRMSRSLETIQLALPKYFNYHALTLGRMFEIRHPGSRVFKISL